MSQSWDWRRIERTLIVLIAIHSYAVGLALMFLTRWGTHLGGWPHVEPLFFARQAGVFHLLIATAYLLEYFRNGTVTLLVLAKISAVVFLVAMMRVEPAPWAVPASALADGLMAVVVLAVRRRARTVTTSLPNVGARRR